MNARYLLVRASARYRLDAAVRRRAPPRFPFCSLGGMAMCRCPVFLSPSLLLLPSPPFLLSVSGSLALSLPVSPCLSLSLPVPLSGRCETQRGLECGLGWHRFDGSSVPLPGPSKQGHTAAGLAHRDHPIRRRRIPGPRRRATNPSPNQPGRLFSGRGRASPAPDAADVNAAEQGTCVSLELLSVYTKCSRSVMTPHGPALAPWDPSRSSAAGP